MSVTRNVTTPVREFGKFYVEISFRAGVSPDHSSRKLHPSEFGTNHQSNVRVKKSQRLLESEARSDGSTTSHWRLDVTKA